MPRFMITRTLPPLTPDGVEQVRVDSTRACSQLGITWVRSHLTADGKHAFCEFDAPSEEAVREHGRITNIPIDAISLLGMEIGPSRVS